MVDSNARRFSGKVAVVTGAAQGIGYAVAERLGKEGASIVIADVASGPANEAKNRLTEMGIATVSTCADLSSFAGAVAAMQCAVDHFDGLHVVVNNVGGTIWAKPFWHYTEKEIRAEVERSFWPTMWCCRAAIEYLRESGGGAIVNVGSNAWIDGVYRIPYSACKGAVASLTKSLAVELASMNIRVNCVNPGRTEASERKTPRNANAMSSAELEWFKQFVTLVQDEELITEPATADDQAAAIAFLASDEARHITGEIVETGRRGIRIKDIVGFVP